MRSVAPRLPGCEEITVAEDQPEYCPITIAVVEPPSGFPAGGRILLARFTLTPDERQRIAAGEDLYVGQLNFGAPMTPLIVSLRALYFQDDAA